VNLSSSNQNRTLHRPLNLPPILSDEDYVTLALLAKSPRRWYQEVGENTTTLADIPFRWLVSRPAQNYGEKVEGDNQSVFQEWVRTVNAVGGASITVTAPATYSNHDAADPGVRHLHHEPEASALFTAHWHNTVLLEADLPIRGPSELDGSGSHGMLTRKVDGSFPVLVGEIPVDLKVFAYAFNHLEVYVVQSSSIGNEVFSGFLVSYPELNPFITA
jgi:hypothetical protein